MRGTCSGLRSLGLAEDTRSVPAVATSWGTGGVVLGTSSWWHLCSLNMAVAGPTVKALVPSAFWAPLL